MNDEEFFLVNDRETVVTPHMHVRCDGGNGPLGHPLEYLTLEKGGEALCGYCGRRYVLEGTEAAQEARAGGTRPAA
ncbi:zinc-finger domain-containing protein [Geminicoccaceae bacterium 1502E]|nr:zinc-finger domain-containing protein [Geminicoccaceae bacterium 1502E]